jgi:hypothetical protein
MSPPLFVFLPGRKPVRYSFFHLLESGSASRARTPIS